jgi:hypothetical protein
MRRIAHTSYLTAIIIGVNFLHTISSTPYV